jgi:dUTP pyrophosphatase
MKVKLEFKPINSHAKEPTRSLSTDVGFDLYAAEERMIHPHDYGFVTTSLRIAAPPGHYYTIEGRSSMYFKGIMTFRGVIDATYTGEVKIGLYNASGKAYKISEGDRIAQLILHEVCEPEFKKVKEFSAEYDQRGDAGWGSSGK